MIDLNTLAIAPGVERLAAVLREEFRVWVALVGLAGEVVPLGAATTPIERPICSIFMANGSVDSTDESASCRASVERWAGYETGESNCECHAGFQSMVLPVHVGGERVANLFVSGYLHGEGAAERVERLRRKLQKLDHENVESLVEDLPVLHLRDRDFVAGFARAIVREVERFAPDHALEVRGDDEPFRYGDMIGESEKMLDLFKTLQKVSRSNSTILIQGENGTGKELIARAIHRNSPRKDAPFVVQNCAAIPADLIESELFGHKKGAFSGAHRDRTGLFEYANHGTFFLDEIGEMDLSMQVKLLRVLQEGTFLPVGDNVYRKVDVRVICATNRDLREEVEAGRFREDLFYRINVITVTAPPLRHRRGDIRILAHHFLAKSCLEHDRPAKTLSDEALDVLEHHAWPGNVRELENEIERLVIMTGDDPVISEDWIRLRKTSRNSFDDVSLANMQMPEAIEKLERKMILEVLQRTGWNKTQTAKELGVSRRNLIRKVAHYELEKKRS